MLERSFISASLDVKFVRDFLRGPLFAEAWNKTRRRVTNVGTLFFYRIPRWPRENRRRERTVAAIYPRIWTITLAIFLLVRGAMATAALFMRIIRQKLACGIGSNIFALVVSKDRKSWNCLRPDAANRRTMQPQCIALQHGLFRYKSLQLVTPSADAIWTRLFAKAESSARKCDKRK